MKTAILISTILVTMFTNGLFAQQPGDLDVTFDGDGKVTTAFGSNTTDQVRSAALQSDGKIVAVGWSDGNIALARYNTDGSLDNSFSIDGKLTTTPPGGYGEARTLVIQTDGKIVIAGQSGNGDFLVMRFNPDGSTDNSFSTDGTVTTDFGMIGDEPYSAALQSDGKIVVVGKSSDGGANATFAVARYNTDGTLDNGFDSDGKVTTAIGTSDEAWSVAIQPDGKIVVAGFSEGYIALARYNTDGTLDNNFDTDGKVTAEIGLYGDAAWAVTLQPDGKIVVAGESYTDTVSEVHFALARFNIDGSLDSTFSNDGKLITPVSTSEDYAFALAIQPDGKIIAAGDATDVLPNSKFALVRYNADGTLDNSFGSNGIVTTAIGTSDGVGAVLIQPDGKIVAVGFATSGTDMDFAVARYISGLNVGVIDFSIVDNVWVYPNPVHDDLRLEYALPQDEVLSIELHDISGKLIKQVVANGFRTKGMHKESLSMTEVITGNYVLTIANGKGCKSIKVTKK